jgi:hypothetical protein
MTAMTSFLRPVASTAARKVGCDQANVDVRSIGVISGKMSPISLKMGVDENAPVRADSGQHRRDA